MSLDPHWYSTIFGVYFFAGLLVVALFAFLALVVLGQRRAGLLRDVVTLEHLHDIGKLLFAFVAFWAYIGFSQYFLIWYANLPEETGFFAERLHGSWRAGQHALAVGHFVVPFFFLLPRAIKRNGKALAAAAVWLLVMHLLDLHWLVMPSLHPDGFAPELARRPDADRLHRCVPRRLRLVDATAGAGPVARPAPAGIAHLREHLTRSPDQGNPRHVPKTGGSQDVRIPDPYRVWPAAALIARGRLRPRRAARRPAPSPTPAKCPA